jgi:hypothetical protein
MGFSLPSAFHSTSPITALSGSESWTSNFIYPNGYTTTVSSFKPVVVEHEGDFLLDRLTQPSKIKFSVVFITLLFVLNWCCS